MSVVQCGDARALPIQTGSVACVVTSPPYNVGINYGRHFEDAMPWPDYIDLANKSAAEIDRVLTPGGRVWVNVQPTVPEATGARRRVNLARIWTEALFRAGLTYRDMIVWVQDAHDGGCAWGSWRSPSTPNMRGSYEVILLFYKGDIWRREPPVDVHEYTDEEEDWIDLVRNVWKINPARSNNFPAPFPMELPMRCIRLSTWPGETVLDPFAGSGTTLNAAEALGRIGIGFDFGGKQ